MAHVNQKKPSYKAKKRQLNIGICVCVLILAYLVVYFFTYYFGSRTSVYEVTEGSIAGKYESQYTAIALREETVVSSPTSGYVNFFVGDATPISIGEQTCILDGSGKISAKLEEQAKNRAILSDDNMSQIKNTLYEFDLSFQPQNYSDIYSFKNRMQSQIMELINGSIFAGIGDELQELGETNYEIVKSASSGVVMHHTDGYENTTKDDLSTADFKKTNYQKHIIKTNDLIAQSDPIYKLITSETWQLIFQIDDPSLFADKKYVNFEFLKDNITASADVEVFTKVGNTYAALTLDKYMIRYLSDRFLQIRILDETEKGLKVPKTAVTERQYYAIPKEYLVQGGASSENGFNKEVLGSDGNATVSFISPPMIKISDTTCYVDTSALAPTDVLLMPETNTRYTVGEKENLKGVYIVNNGYAAFRLIDIIGENNSFTIIANKKAGGVRLYDQVIRNGSHIEEGDLVNR